MTKKYIKSETVLLKEAWKIIDNLLVRIVEERERRKLGHNDNKSLSEAYEKAEEWCENHCFD